MLHGGSGIPGAMRRTLAKEARVKKFNIGTELRMAFDKALRRAFSEQLTEFDRTALLASTMPELRLAAMRVMRELDFGDQ